jgi:Na+-driven multidrug efflux pump
MFPSLWLLDKRVSENRPSGLECCHENVGRLILIRYILHRFWHKGPERLPDPRRQMMLNGPIAGTLLRFAAPTIAVVTVQAFVSVMETYFVGFLGTDALAGVALVFPVLMLMQMMSAGGMGGGVASAVARALGAGRKADADALAMHSVIIAIALGLIFMITVLTWGPPLYRLLGGQGPALQAALTYSNVVFAGSVPVWLFNTQAAVLRGLIAGVAPQLWISIFSDAPDVMGTGQTYLQIVGPFYGFLGAAMILYFSSQGAGQMLWPFVGGMVRLLLATIGTWMAVHQFGAGLAGLSWMITSSFVVFSLVSALALRQDAWRLAVVRPAAR